MDILDSGQKLISEGVVEDGGVGFDEGVLLEIVERRMDMEPNCQKLHENVLAAKSRVKQEFGLLLPLLAKIGGDLAQKDTIPVKLINFVIVLEQLKFGIIVSVG